MCIRDSSEVELETFSCDNKRVHPMQFISRVREFNKFNTNSWEVQLLKILKCFKGSSEIWAEVHKTEWGCFESFEAAFRNKYWSEEDQEVLRSRIMAVSYTHLDVYKRQTIYKKICYLPGFFSANRRTEWDYSIK